MLTFAVCDDDSVYRECIKEKILDYADRKNIICQVDVYGSGEELLAQKNRTYKVYFLDMQMKEIDGMKVAEEIREADSQAVLVFVSGYIQYAARGYCVNAVRYVLNPHLEEEFDDCMDAVAEHLAGEEKTLDIHIGTRDVTVRLDEIIYMENVKRKVLFHMEEAEGTVYETYAKITELAEMLSRKGFIYCHAAYVVNAQKVVDIGTKEFTMVTGEKIPISRQKYLQAQKDYYFYRVKSNVFH